MPTYLISDEERFIQETAQRFAAEKLRPGYQVRDDSKVIDRDLLKGMGELGLLTPNISEEYGGIAASSVICGLIAEQIA